MRYHITFPSGEEVPVDVTHLPTGEIQVEVNGQRVPADILDAEGYVNLRIDGRVVDMLLEGNPPQFGVVTKGLRFYANVESDRTRAMSAALAAKSTLGDGLVTSPMNGRILKVLVGEGDRVAAGHAMVVVEAMKMENEILAPRDGVVRKIFVTPGTTVESGEKLVEIGD